MQSQHHMPVSHPVPVSQEDSTKVVVLGETETNNNKKKLLSFHSRISQWIYCYEPFRLFITADAETKAMNGRRSERHESRSFSSIEHIKSSVNENNVGLYL